jgi:hypothetical protein
MKLEELKRLCLETPSLHDLINTTGWIAAIRLVLPKLVDVAQAAKDYSLSGDSPTETSVKLQRLMFALDNLETLNGRANAQKVQD